MQIIPGHLLVDRGLECEGKGYPGIKGDIGKAQQAES